jgi:ribonuclease P protein component
MQTEKLVVYCRQKIGIVLDVQDVNKRETHLPAPSQTAQAQTGIPVAYVHQSRQAHYRAPAAKGSSSASGDVRSGRAVLPSLRRRKDVSSFLAAAKRFHCKDFTLLVSPSADGVSRCLVVAGRKAGKAVQRNRARRRMRAVIALLSPKLSGNWWIGIICGPDVCSARWQSLLMQTQQALELAGVVRGGGCPPSE